MLKSIFRQTVRRLYTMDQALPTIEVKKDTFEGLFSDYLKSIPKNEKLPNSIHELKPHHVSVIGALGDSLTIASRSNDYESQNNVYTQFPANSWMTGTSENHLSVHNILNFLSEKRGVRLFGGSCGQGYGDHTNFNVAVGGRTSEDLPRQAEDLVNRMKKEKELDIENSWKLISLWIGTNDLGYDVDPPVPEEVYKKSVETALQHLKTHLPRTLVAIVEPCPPQLFLEAPYLIENEKRNGTEKQQETRTNFTNGYRKALYEIQNEGKFNDDAFTVVVQPFIAGHDDAYRNKFGAYDQSFYTWDKFHLSKLGNALLAKSFWQGLFESSTVKNQKADLTDTSANIFVPTYEKAIIRTIGN